MFPEEEEEDEVIFTKILLPDSMARDLSDKMPHAWEEAQR